MRYGVIADIHANLHALDAVLAALDREGVDAYLCAGDLVGYGALPNHCVARVREIGAVCVAGNHDLIALGRLAGDRCIPLARNSLEWTREVLGREARMFLESLPLTDELDGIVIAHGTLDSPEDYVYTEEEARAQLARLPAGARGLVLGHTHVQLRIPGRPFALNPGSVGQSRNGETLARYAVLDGDTGRAALHAVPYDVAAARRALRDAGLPRRSLHLKPSRLRRIAGRVLRRQ
jgi:putative phosphoesterase